MLYSCHVHGDGPRGRVGSLESQPAPLRHHAWLAKAVRMMFIMTHDELDMASGQVDLRTWYGYKIHPSVRIDE